LEIEFKGASNPDPSSRCWTRRRLVIVDLKLPQPAVATIEKLRATQKELRVVAFLSHVRPNLRPGRAAGCLEVMPRSYSHKIWRPYFKPRRISARGRKFSGLSFLLNDLWCSSYAPGAIGTTPGQPPAADSPATALA